jgi:DNA polymerase (family 10)
MGLPIMPPELREDRGEIEAARDGKLPHLIELSDVQGDLHCHTDWSDGIHSLEEMAFAAKRLGYHYLAITDHSVGLGVARGLSTEKLRQQRAAIDEFNSRQTGITLIAGIEVNIRADGSLDYEEDVMREFDIVTASIHSGLNQPKERITQRLVAAASNPYVDIIGHPTGRLIGTREPSELDLEEVLKAAARTGTAVEINSGPDRLDLDDVGVRRAKELEVKIAISSDAHAMGQLSWMRLGVAVARRGWLEKDDVLNTLPLNQLLRQLSRHRNK